MSAPIIDITSWGCGWWQCNYIPDGTYTVGTPFPFTGTMWTAGPTGNPDEYDSVLARSAEDAVAAFTLTGNGGIAFELSRYSTTTALNYHADGDPFTNWNATVTYVPGMSYDISSYWTSSFECRSNTQKIITTPSDKAQEFGIFTYGNIPGLTNLIFNHITNSVGFHIEYCDDLTEINFPNLVSIDPNNTQNEGIFINQCSSLTSFSMSVLTTVGSKLIIKGASSLTTLSFPLLHSVGNFICSNHDSLTSLNFPNLYNADRGVYIDTNTSLTSISCPNLTTISTGGGFQIVNTAITNVNFPSLQSVGAGVYFYQNSNLLSISLPNLQSIDLAPGTNVDPSLYVMYSPLLTTISLPNLENTGHNILCTGLTSLSSFNAPKWIPTSGKNINFQSCSLNNTSINLILSRSVAAQITGSIITLNEGTNSPPTEQGLLDVITLRNAPNTVYVNSSSSDPYNNLLYLSGSSLSIPNPSGSYNYYTQSWKEVHAHNCPNLVGLNVSSNSLKLIDLQNLPSLLNLDISINPIIVITSSLTTIGGTFNCSYCNSSSIINFPNLTNVNNFNCNNCNSLNTLNLPTLTSVGSSLYGGFNGSLTTLNLFSLNYVGGNFNFQGCNSLTTLNINNLTHVGGDFDCNDCNSLITLNLPVLGSVVGIFNCYNCPSLTTMSLDNLSTVYSFVECNFNSSLIRFSLPLLNSAAGIDCRYNSSLIEINLPSLTATTYDFKCDSCNSLTTISFNNFRVVGNGDFNCSNCTSLTTLNLPAFETCSGAFFGNFISNNCNSLTTVNIPQWAPINGKTINFNNCALNTTSVNSILARCIVSKITGSTIYLNGGTNAAPTGQGLTAVTTLRNAPNTVYVNP